VKYLIIALLVLAKSSLAISYEEVGATTPRVKQLRDVSALKIERPTLVQFWASWCHSCGTIMYDVDKLLSQYQDISYVAISMDENQSDAENYLKKHSLYSKYETNFFYDVDQQLAMHYSVHAVPTLILLDSNGIECMRTKGHLTGDDLFKMSNTMAGLRSKTC